MMTVLSRRRTGVRRVVMTVQNLGVTEGKNLLGVLCLVFGLGSIWRVVDEMRQPESRTRQLVIYGIVLALVCWLLRLRRIRDIAGVPDSGRPAHPRDHHRRRQRHHGGELRCGWDRDSSGLFGFLVLDGYGYAVQALGRDATLTGRTELWELILGMNADPLLGTGFESFFLGNRAKELQIMFHWAPNEAHNGYIEICLTLGWIGLGLFVLQVAVGYCNILRVVRSDPALGALKAAIFAAALIYNVTETSFKVRHPLWIVFLAIGLCPLLVRLRITQKDNPQRMPQALNDVSVTL